MADRPGPIAGSRQGASRRRPRTDLAGGKGGPASGASSVGKPRAGLRVSPASREFDRSTTAVLDALALSATSWQRRSSRFLRETFACATVVSPSPSRMSWPACWPRASTTTASGIGTRPRRRPLARSGAPTSSRGRPPRRPRTRMIASPASIGRSPTWALPPRHALIRRSSTPSPSALAPSPAGSHTCGPPAEPRHAPEPRLRASPRRAPFSGRPDRFIVRPILDFWARPAGVSRPHDGRGRACAAGGLPR